MPLSEQFPFAYIQLTYDGATALLYRERPTVGGAVAARSIRASSVANLRERLNVEGYLARDYDYGVYSRAVLDPESGAYVPMS